MSNLRIYLRKSLIFKQNEFNLVFFNCKRKNDINPLSSDKQNNSVNTW